ncbi:methenyltetrahydrofolate synthase domain-containing protein lost [Lycorma delicatula]|uniref:methenyltetrahydrofolate synthase domain-containing protein lost n=1 Tax=Lycorma delicatula TaxID=130591 RepID=UPI003F513FD9
MADTELTKDSVTSSHQVNTKSNDTSDSVVEAVNCEKSVQSSDSVENPINNSQVSSQGLTGAKEELVPVSSTPLPEDSKQSIRLKVWDLLEKKNYVLFPRLCKGRIPHFVGSPEAAEKLATLDNFKNAKNIKVNPDKPQAHVRFLTLEAGKNLLVPIPRLRSGLFKRVVPPTGATKEQLKTVVTQQGILNYGQPLGLNDKVSIDLVVMGAVAVSKEGFRIGKGEGYADLEFAIMMKMGAITQDTVVITTVHDEQVFDTLPNHLFKEHDVPVDFIVTPTQVYEVQPRLPKPSGIYWNILSNRRLQLIPILKTLRDQEIAEGKGCELKEVDSDPEDRPIRPFKYIRRLPRQLRKDSQMQGKNQRPQRERSAPPATPNVRPSQRSRQSRTFRRKPVAARSSSAKEQLTRNTESGNVNRRKQQNMVERVRAGGDGVRPMRHRYFPRPKAPIVFSIRLSGITQGTRVRDLKSALSERGIKTYDITWVSNKGRAVLHFSRNEMDKNKKPEILAELTSLNIVEGFPAKLEVKLLGNAKSYKYEWCVNGKPVNMAGRSKIISRLDGTAALLISDVKIEDAGEYSVNVKNKHGEVTSKGSLVVTAKTKTDIPESEPKFNGEVGEISVNRNDSLCIAASITGNPVPDVEWSKDGDIVPQSGRTQLLCDGNKVELKINLCKMNDAGVYKCKLTNKLGEAECSVKVVVNKTSSVSQINNITKDITVAMDDIIAALQDLKVKGEGEEDPKDSLCVEPANPVTTRIESTGVSAV